MGSSLTSHYYPSAAYPQLYFSRHLSDMPTLTRHLRPQAYHTLTCHTYCKPHTTFTCTYTYAIRGAATSHYPILTCGLSIPHQYHTLT